MCQVLCWALKLQYGSHIYDLCLWEAHNLMRELYKQLYGSMFFHIKQCCIAILSIWCIWQGFLELKQSRVLKDKLVYKKQKDNTFQRGWSSCWQGRNQSPHWKEPGCFPRTRFFPLFFPDETTIKKKKIYPSECLMDLRLLWKCYVFILLAFILNTSILNSLNLKCEGISALHSFTCYFWVFWS